MAVVLRLRRTGRKNLPCFRIIATDSRFPRDGRLLEKLGTYDPLRKDDAARIQVDLERVKHWLSVGAKPSDIVASILRKRGLHAVVPKKRGERERGKKTKARERREKLDTERTARKTARFAERKKQKRAAAKAAAAAGGEAKTEQPA